MREELRERTVQALYEHTSWATVSEDREGRPGHWVNCYDCGAILGDADELVREWEAYTGYDNHTEWCKGTSVPAYELAMSKHQADAVMAVVEPALDAARAEGAAEALAKVGRGYCEAATLTGMLHHVALAVYAAEGPALLARAEALHPGQGDGDA